MHRSTKIWLVVAGGVAAALVGAVIYEESKKAPAQIVSKPMGPGTGGVKPAPTQTAQNVSVSGTSATAKATAGTLTIFAPSPAQWTSVVPALGVGTTSIGVGPVAVVQLTGNAGVIWCTWQSTGTDSVGLPITTSGITVVTVA